MQMTRSLGISTARFARLGVAAAFVFGMLALAALVSSGQTASAQGTNANAFFAQDWKLNPATSKLSVTSTKLKTIVETHEFTGLDGSVSPDGSARVEVNLSSLATGVDIRDVRMRFLFFETFKFPSAVITARLDKSKLSGVLAGTPVSLTLPVELDLHGVKKQLNADVLVTRSGPNSISVISSKPVVVQVADFDLTESLGRLSAAMNNIEIIPAATITFQLVFEAAAGNKQLETVRNEAARRQTEAQTRELTVEECQNRMDVISKTRQIFFATGSAEINARDSAPVLDEVAQFLNRCPSVSIEIAGHTDLVGTKEFNQTLSEQRAASVAGALAKRGVMRQRFKTVGYGFSSPIADNGNEAGRSQNRRIEFRRQ
jgi:OOP family OmpA-OmpF porin